MPGLTADIGCGSGRDTAWLNQQGFSATGFDASEGLLSEARRRHPDINFQHAALPRLPPLAGSISMAPSATFSAETVISHLPPTWLVAVSLGVRGADAVPAGAGGMERCI